MCGGGEGEKKEWAPPCAAVVVGGTYQGQRLRLGVGLDDADGAGRAVQQAVDVLHDAQAAHQVVALQEAADALQLLLLLDVHGHPRIQRLLAVRPVLD